ncbi:MAG: ABC transporter permease subunit [Clostridia bacterium]|nr:ABC transporter permease subunit [Clostridia bacterium]
MQIIGQRAQGMGFTVWAGDLHAGGRLAEHGVGTILYLSAITGINPELFEAAKIDGANKLQQIWHVTLPGIRATIVVLLILNVGQMMNKRHPGSAVHR